MDPFVWNPLHTRAQVAIPPIEEGNALDLRTVQLFLIVAPAEAGVQESLKDWIPAFARMT